MAALGDLLANIGFGVFRHRGRQTGYFVFYIELCLSRSGRCLILSRIQGLNSVVDSVYLGGIGRGNTQVEAGFVTFETLEELE